ncbi:Rpn family recombination-promoting nuclease/putative transposase [Nostoc sp. JL33]|uniref:Rpn family recombination-promoting nuclease/putative transposase n=1 Tax=Nostoc sp. JL33 TaxID=2815396 RepID=UPI0025F4697A|nr:Rpn family recombination-promoting nuclease/putative transposase [Nostoc sp. JL33]MBN3872271.1 Rpn family recombination-promoting nuclease/putative transposase [Nostoc sp. JL33]
MKTDSIFYRLFQTFPSAFFELINLQASEANAYNFASVELKQTAFRIDGVFLPLADTSSQPIYFVEVQFQKDNEFYARLFSEIFLYLRLYAPTKDWRAVVIFPRRSLEPIQVQPYRVLLESQLVTRLYLNELGEVTEYSLGVGIIKLVVVNKKQTPILVKSLITRTRSELSDKALQGKVLDLIETIVVYKLPRISRQELIKMFGLGDFDIKTTRIYEEVRDDIIEEVRNEVRQKQTLEVVMRQLRRRIGNLSQQLLERISQLSIEQLENLAEALLDFSTEGDLVVWLQDNLTQT